MVYKEPFLQELQFSYWQITYLSGLDLLYDGPDMDLDLDMQSKDDCSTFCFYFSFHSKPLLLGMTFAETRQSICATETFLLERWNNLCLFEQLSNFAK